MPSKRPGVSVTTNMTGIEFDRLRDVPHGTPYDEVFMMLEKRIDKLEEALMWEEKIRKSNPVLQDLYEQYQTMRRLVVDKDAGE